MKKLLNIFPLAYALLHSLKNGYNFTTFKHDFIAALVVSLVALPLAMALAVAVGLSPQYGLYTAIIAGIIVPLLGGSVFQVSGPTAAFVVIVAPIVSEHGLRGLIIATIIAGIILIALGIAKLGQYINYVPYQVTLGFTSGIAVVIGTLALNDFLGLHIENLQGNYIHKLSLIIQNIPNLYWPEAIVGMVSLMTMIFIQKTIPKIPASLAGISIGALLAYLLQQNGFEISTIGNNFTFQTNDGSIGYGVPPFLPKLHWLNFEQGNIFSWPSYDEIKVLIVPSLVIAALAALESLLSATVADGIAGTKHNPNSELLSIGIGNILSGLAMGIPATGAIARTAANIHSGAKTPIASSLHALFILCYVLLLAPIMSYIPMAALAALLLTIAYRMSHYKQFIRIIQIAPRSDSIVLLVCFTLTVFIDMIAGITAGVILACFLFIQRISRLTEVQISHAKTNHTNYKLPDDVLIYRINGLLFFGTAEKALDCSKFRNINTLIIDMGNVPLIDMTGIITMKTLILDFITANQKVILCGKQEITEKILQKIPAKIKHQAQTVKNLKLAVQIIQD